MSDPQGTGEQGGETGLWPRSALIDQPYLDVCRQSGVTPQRLLQMADVFEAQLAEDRLAMLEAVEAGDLARVQACAHRLKGSSGSLGLPVLRSHAARLEEAAKTGRTATCRTALGQLKEMGRITLQAFREALWPLEMP